MPNFVSFATSIAALAHGEKSRTQSRGLNHPASLNDFNGNNNFKRVFDKYSLSYELHCYVVCGIQYLHLAVCCFH